MAELFITPRLTDSRYSSRTSMNINPEFWDHIIRKIPVCVELEKNWEKIRDEFISYYEHEHPFPVRDADSKNFTNPNMLPSPNLKIKDDDGVEEKNLYSGAWDVCFAGTPPLEDGKQWGNTELVSRVVKWKTKKDLNYQLDYSKSYFKTFNSIVEEFADANQCSGAMFSIVRPGTVINPHMGSDGIMRTHLCLINDTNCLLTVGSKTRSWEEGKILAFKDGNPYPHSVVHSGSNDRVVLIFDFDLNYLRSIFSEDYL